MSSTMKILAEGQLPNSKTTLATSTNTSTIRTLIASIVLTNVTGGAITVNLYLKKSGGVSRKIMSAKSLAANETYVFKPGAIMEPNSVLEGDASAATSIDYWVSGVEINQ